MIEEDIEALTRLLSLVGGELDHPKAKNYIDAYFAKLQVRRYTHTHIHTHSSEGVH